MEGIILSAENKMAVVLFESDGLKASVKVQVCQLEHVNPLLRLAQDL